MGEAFDTAQALYDAAKPADDNPDLVYFLKQVVGTLKHDTIDLIDDYDDVHGLSDRQATVAIWIAGREYSLTLNREDG